MKRLKRSKEDRRKLDNITLPGFSTDFDAAALTARLMKNPNSSIAQRLAFMGAMAKLGVDGETARFLWKLQKQCPSMDVAQLVALGGDFGVAIGKTLTIEEFILFLQALIAVLVAIPEFVVSKIGEKGTKTTSKTTGKTGNGEERVDVENPAPGVRDGDIHYHEPDGTKWRYDIKNKQFVNPDPNNPTPAPPRI